MSAVRRVMLTVTAGAVVALAVAGAAWACTAQPRVMAVRPNEAAPKGSTVTVSGNHAGSQTPVEVRWNALDGEAVGTGVADPTGAFSVPVTVPDVAPGIYSLVVDGAGAGVGRIPIEVAGDGSDAAEALTAAWPTPASPLGSPVSPRSQPALWAGVGLLALGSVALVASFATASLTRRRAPTAASR